MGVHVGSTNKTKSTRSNADALSQSRIYERFDLKWGLFAERIHHSPPELMPNTIDWDISLNLPTDHMVRYLRMDNRVHGAPNRNGRWSVNMEFTSWSRVIVHLEGWATVWWTSRGSEITSYLRRSTPSPRHHQHWVYLFCLVTRSDSRICHRKAMLSLFERVGTHDLPRRLVSKMLFEADIKI